MSKECEYAKELKKDIKKKKILKNYKLDPDLVNAFEKKCLKNKLKFSKVISALMEDFIK